MKRDELAAATNEADHRRPCLLLLFLIPEAEGLHVKFINFDDVVRGEGDGVTSDGSGRAALSQRLEDAADCVLLEAPERGCLMHTDIDALVEAREDARTVEEWELTVFEAAAVAKAEVVLALSTAQSHAIGVARVDRRLQGVLACWAWPVRR